jgi:hypothetical protein
MLFVKASSANSILLSNNCRITGSFGIQSPFSLKARSGLIFTPLHLFGKQFYRIRRIRQEMSRIGLPALLFRDYNTSGNGQRSKGVQ